MLGRQAAVYQKSSGGAGPQLATTPSRAPTSSAPNPSSGRAPYPGQGASTLASSTSSVPPPMRAPTAAIGYHNLPLASTPDSPVGCAFVFAA